MSHIGSVLFAAPNKQQAEGSNTNTDPERSLKHRLRHSATGCDAKRIRVSNHDELRGARTKIRIQVNKIPLLQ